MSGETRTDWRPASSIQPRDQIIVLGIVWTVTSAGAVVDGGILITAAITTTGPMLLHATFDAFTQPETLIEIVRPGDSA